MSRRALTIALPGAVALIAAGYAVFWWVAATRVVDGVDRWADARRAEGWTVAYERVRASGFPLWIVVDVERPALEAPTADGSATGRATRSGRRCGRGVFGGSNSTPSATTKPAIFTCRRAEPSRRAQMAAAAPS